MRAKHSRLVVVDASVARSAGETEHPISSSCRNVLVSIRDICHHVVVTKAIQKEWSRHASKFTLRWLGTMTAKKKVQRPPSFQIDIAEGMLTGLSASEQDALRKDMCLVEATCVGDGIIITRDNAIVAVWEKCRDRLNLPKTIQWVYPATCDAHLLERL